MLYSNVHEWEEGNKYRKCEHDPYVTKKAWVKKTSDDHKILKKIIQNSHILMDLKNHFCQTSMVNLITMST